MTFATKQAAFDALEEARADWLIAARAWARSYGRHGQVITINDVRRYGPPLPEGVDPRVCGVVFRNDEWENLGYTSSTRKVSHNRPVAQFRLLGAGQ